MFVLEHFFLLGIGLGPYMKWAGVAKFFGPIDVIMNIIGVMSIK